MKIGIIGAGPAGLYFAALMARSDPDHDITVIERNPPDATFGWGVVFSEGTLAELQDVDYETYIDITDRFVRWSAIDIRHRDRVTRSYGHGFSAISRRTLLRLLQERCRERGVELVFQDEMESLDRFADCDLIVAADGVNSRVRELRADAFRPTLDVHATKYAWFGTDLVFDAFTFIFEETPHGLFQVHAYPFDDQTSTFIVECTEAVWRNAGLAGMGEDESMAFCEEVFAEHLGGHKLMSNRSLWLSFVTVSNESWHHDNIALMGDAAATAHFTIGSGTKLAMEGAVALHKGLLEHPDDLEAAFASYELERQPAVARFQKAARESSDYFEHVSRYLDFDPVRFAFNLLTRSGRITHLGLEDRDPAIVAAVDRLQQAQGSGGKAGPGAIVSVPAMLAPLQLHDVTISNRIALSPIADDSCGDGLLSEGLRATLQAAAASGVGLITTEEVAVDADARVNPGSPGIYATEHTAAWNALIDGIHQESGARVGMMLSHAGSRGATRPRRRGVDRPLPDGGWPLIAASPLPYTKRSSVPKEMDRRDMDRVRAEHAAAAQRAYEAGCDLLIVDLGRGHLLSSFLSPLSNHRTDEYGGDFEARLRYPLEVLTAVRQAWPVNKPLGVRLSVTDWAGGGLPISEAVKIAARCGEGGASLVEVSAGFTVHDARPEYGRLFLVPLADRIRNETGLAAMVRGGITTFDEVNTIVASGRADVCLLDPVLYQREIVQQL